MQILTKNEIDIDAQIAHLKNERERIRRNRFWQCSQCGKKTQIKNLYIVFHYWYVSPYGCAGGDYWTQGEHPEYGVICPYCPLTKHRYLDYYDLYKFVKEYRLDFGGKINEYDRGSREPSKWEITEPLPISKDVYQEINEQLEYSRKEFKCNPQFINDNRKIL